MVIASELKEGMFIRVEGHIYEVLEAESKAGTAKLSGVVKTKLRNVTSGRTWEPHFRPDERLEDLELEQQTLEFLFSDADGCTFMNPRTFEQIEVPRAILGMAEQFLQSGMQLPVQFFEGRPISAIVPDVVEARVALQRRPRTRNKTAPGRKQHSITVSAFECLYSLLLAKLCGWKSKPVAMSNEQGVSASEVRKN